MKESLRQTHGLVLFLCFGLVALTGCDRSGKRLKENPPPNPLVTKKVDGTQGHLLAGSKKALLKSANLKAADATAILKGFNYTAKAKYVFKKGDKTLTLNEQVKLKQAANGSFHLTLTNNRQKGYEVIWTDKTLYQKMRHRPYRVVSKNIDDAHRWQQRAIGRWRSIVGIFGPYLALTQGGGTNLSGRSVYKYQIALTKEIQEMPKQKEGTAWAGKVPDATRGAAAKKPRIPMSARGQLWVDQESGLPLKVVFRGKYSIGGGKQRAIASLSLNATFSRPTSTSIEEPDDDEIAAVGREVDAYDPFHRKKPGFLQPPPEDLNKKAKRKRRKRRRSRRRRRRRRRNP